MGKPRLKEVWIETSAQQKKRDLMDVSARREL
jgi:hypothetical protein